ncbi:MAG: Nudix family hydrolase [Oceanospirillales bacterium]|nr:Nudix family hydrolase [Oceanospirillales bacterium]
MKLVHVAAAIIVDAEGRVLIARRDASQHQGGLWEFPGGKVEKGEAVESALARELDEELGIQVESARPQIRITHHYADKSVLLDVWRVERFSGEAHGREGQPIRWVAPSALVDFEFPAANTPIVSAARLPDRLFITGNIAELGASPDQYEAELVRRVRQLPADSLVMLRAPELDDEALSRCYYRLLDVCVECGIALVLNSSLELANTLGADRLHLSARRLKSLDTRSQFFGRWLSASCHNQEELHRAAQLGADFVTLSPVAPTASHPGAPVLGWNQFWQLTERSTMPIYALGGLSGEDLQEAWNHGAQGVASISSWWGRF